MKFFFILLFLVGCVEPILQPGSYSVDFTIVESNWGDVNQEFNEIWHIEEDSGVYIVSFDYDDWKFKGVEKGEFIYFLYHRNFNESENDCIDFNRLDAFVFPDKNGNKFTAKLTSELFMCDVSTCPPRDPNPECTMTEFSLKRLYHARGERM